MTVWRVQVRPCAPCGSEQGRTFLHGELAQGVELAARLGAVRVALAVQDLAQGLVEDVTEAALARLHLGKDDASLLTLAVDVVDLGLEHLGSDEPGIRRCESAESSEGARRKGERRTGRECGRGRRARSPACLPQTQTGTCTSCCRPVARCIESGAGERPRTRDRA